VIVGSYVLAALFPTFGLWIRHVTFGSLDSQAGKIGFSLPPIMLALILFNAGLGVKTRELGQLLQNPKLLLGGVVGNLATPLVFILALKYAMGIWHNPEEVQQILMGLALVASMPIAGASAAWSQNANGNLAVSLGLVLLTTILSPLLTPAVLHAVGFVTTGDYAEDLHELARDGVTDFLALWVVLPSLLGILTHKWLGEARLEPARHWLKLSNYIILILLNYSNAALTLPKVLSEPDPDFLAIMIVIVTGLCITAFATGYGLAQLLKADRPSMISLMFGLGMNNNGTGLVLASMALSDHAEIMIPIIFYNLTQHIVAAAIDRFWIQPTDAIRP
jgi:BASS family bile acid:Na+ symporter